MNYSSDMLTDSEFAELSQFLNNRRFEFETIYSDYADVELALEDEMQRKINEIVNRRPKVEEKVIEINELEILKEKFLKQLNDDETTFYVKYNSKDVYGKLIEYFIEKLDRVSSVDELKDLKEEYNNSLELKEKAIKRAMSYCDECNQKYIKMFDSKYRDENFNDTLNIYRHAFITNNEKDFLNIIGYNLDLFVLIKFKEAFRRQVVAAKLDFNSNTEIITYCDDILSKIGNLNTIAETEALINEFNNKILMLKNEKVLLSPGKSDEIPLLNPGVVDINDEKGDIPVVDLPNKDLVPLLEPSKEMPLLPSGDENEKTKEESSEEEIKQEPTNHQVDEKEAAVEPVVPQMDRNAYRKENQEKVETKEETKKNAPRKFKVIFKNCNYKIPGYGNLEVEENTVIHGPLIDPVPLNESGKPKKFTAKVFDGWVDEYGNVVDLSKPVTSDMVITASYRFDRKKALVMAAGAAVGTLAYVADLAIPTPVPVVSIAGSAGFGIASRALQKNVANLNNQNAGLANSVTAVTEPPAELLENIQKAKKRNYWKMFCKTAAAACGISAAVHGIQELKSNSLGTQTQTPTPDNVFETGEFRGYELGNNKVYRTAADSLNGTNGVQAYAPAFNGDKVYQAYYNGVRTTIKPGDSLQSILDAVGAKSVDQVAVNVMDSSGGYLTWASLSSCVEGLADVASKVL